MKTRILVNQDTKGELTTEHSTSSYGLPVVVINNTPYGSADMIGAFGDNYQIMKDYSVEAQEIDFDLSELLSQEPELDINTIEREKELFKAARRVGYSIDMPESWFE